MTASDRQLALADASEPPSLPARLNWLRAGVLGANDGIVSTAALVIGVAGATAQRGSVLLAGVVGLLAGALSMATGEFVSVSTQRDSQRAILRRQRRLLQLAPDRELAALAAVFVRKGIDERTAFRVAEELTAHDAVAAHAESRLGVDPDDLTSPWQAALASFVAFTVGALVPLVGVIADSNAWVTVSFVTAALLATGLLSAQLGRAPVGPAVLRNVGGGLLAMAVTFGLGTLVGSVL